MCKLLGGGNLDFLPSLLFVFDLSIVAISCVEFFKLDMGDGSKWHLIVRDLSGAFPKRGGHLFHKCSKAVRAGRDCSLWRKRCENTDTGVFFKRAMIKNKWATQCELHGGGDAL